MMMAKQLNYNWKILSPENPLPSIEQLDSAAARAEKGMNDCKHYSYGGKTQMP